MGVIVIREDKIKHKRSYLNTDLSKMNALLTINPNDYSNTANIYAFEVVGESRVKLFYNIENIKSNVQFYAYIGGEWVKICDQIYTKLKNNNVVVKVNTDNQYYVKFKNWTETGFEIESNSVLLGDTYTYTLDQFTSAPHLAGESQIFVLSEPPYLANDIQVYLNGILLDQLNYNVGTGEIEVIYPNDVTSNYEVQVFYSSPSEGIALIKTDITESFVPPTNITAGNPFTVTLSHTPLAGTHIFAFTNGINLDVNSVTVIGTSLTVILDYDITSTWKLTIKYSY